VTVLVAATWRSESAVRCGNQAGWVLVAQAACRARSALVITASGREAAVQDEAGQGCVERDGEQQVTVIDCHWVGMLGGLHAGAEYLESAAGGAHAASRVCGVSIRYVRRSAGEEPQDGGDRGGPPRLQSQ
jgi:hypothetical protein